MLDTFASLSVNAFDVTRTDVDGQKREFRPAVDLQTLRHGMPDLLKTAIQQQHNVIVRPKHARLGLIQLDDLSADMVERLKHAAFLVLATSVGNYQVWVAVPECAPDFPRRLRRGSGADPGASGAARLAGSLNFKRKYAPHFPQVEILQATLQHTVTAAVLQDLGVVAPPDVTPATRPRPCFFTPRAKAWPSYERCLQQAPPAQCGDRPDVSRADFTYCLLALDWGWSLEETCEHLMEHSTKARAHGERYARLTVQRAAAAIYRRSLNSTQIRGKSDVE
jgi:hypothetical protein